MRVPRPRLGTGLRVRRPALATVATAPAAVAPGRARPAARAARRRLPSGSTTRLLLVLAAVAYLPLLLTQRGWVSADTKTYLYLDPSRLMSRAWSTWDPSIGLGTVTHQNIGYLWPMGPWYWVLDKLGVPDWAAQRLWWGTIIFAAGAGVVYLLRTLGWKGPGVIAATFGYALSPYLLTLVARLSAILLPFSALPWLIALTIRTSRTKGWRYPALFALVVVTCGGVNATALLLVGIAPVLWLVHAVWAAKEISLRRAVRTCLRLGVLTVPVSAWWIAGLSVQGTNGIEILRYTETAKTVAAVSVSHEVLRGLGYWFFYGGDRLGAWIEPSVQYTQFLPLLAFTYMIPIAGLMGAVVARWRHRAYFVMLLAAGVALSVGAYPWKDGSPVSRGIKAFVLSDVGLSMRSLPRAVPLVALSLAVLAGAGVTSIDRRWPRVSRPLTIGVVLCALLALPPLWQGRFVPHNLRRPETLPSYWTQAADHLNAKGPATRVLVVPGSDFASYRWGNTVDPVLPGLMDRPSVQRELIPYGSPPSANLLNAFDLRLQERTADPASVAPLARLMRAGDVLVQSDLQYERYNTPRPRNFWDFIEHAAGLGAPTTFGSDAPNLTVPNVQLDDELLLQTDPRLPNPHALAALPVKHPVEIVSTHPAEHPLLVAGDGAGIVDGAGEGLLDGTELVRYSASLSRREIRAALHDDAALLLTDSNRKRGERWTTIRHTRGLTEPAAYKHLVTDYTDNRLPVFPGAPISTQSVAVEQGGVQAVATSYGNPITFTTEERPSLALDGDLETGWRTSAFSDARGERIELHYAKPTTADRVKLTQVTNGSRNRFITKVRLRFDGAHAMDVELADQSRDDPGQVITFPSRTFRVLSIEILADSAGTVPRYAGLSSVGFAEIAVGAHPARQVEAIRLPTDLLAAAGARSIDHPLAISLTRQRQDPTDVTRVDEEAGIARVFTLPGDGRSFSLEGQVRLERRGEPLEMDEILGRPHDGSVTWARAGTLLTGSTSTASMAFDGRTTTAWTSVRSEPNRQWVEINLPAPVTITHLPVSVIADGLHSVPTQFDLEVDGRRVGDIPTGPISDTPRQNATHTVDVRLAKPVTGSTFRLTIDGVREVRTHDWVSDRDLDQPAAIAEIGLPGPKVPALPATYDSGCRDDLLTADGKPVPVRITGPTSALLAGRPATLTACGGRALTLDGGRHEIAAAKGRTTGLDIDRLVLRSAAGGGAAPARAGTLVAQAGGDPAAGPRVEVVGDGHDHSDVRITGATPGKPFWLVLGQSHNPGWTATVGGRSLGEPQLVDGFANGWKITPTAASFRVDMTFTPQRRVDAAIVFSLVAALLCLVLLIRRPRPVVNAPSSLAEPYSSVLAFRYDGALPARRVAVWTGLGVGLLSWLLAGPAVGIAIGIAAGVGARHETFRRYLLLASPVALGVCALYVLYIQARWRPTASFDWPIEMRRPHPIGWAAVLLLVADVIVDRVWQARRSDTG